MKNLIFGIVVLVFVACNNTKTTSETTTIIDTTSTVTKTLVDTLAPKQNPAGLLDPVINNYLNLKNALVKDNSKLAAESGKDLVKSLSIVDKSAMSEDQLKVFSEVVEDARENAEHIGDNSGKIAHQREHFELLSEDIYQLLKVFGSQRNLYLDHCPMYNDGKGGDWISDTKDITNPYYGSKMLTCGKIKEEL